MTQLEALRLADMLENNYPLEPEAEEAAAELRRLHEENEQLRQALAQPVDAVNISAERVDETAKGEHEPFIYVREDNERPFGGYEHCSEADAGAFPVYTAPPKHEWVGLTDEEVHEVVSKKWWDWEDAFDIEGFSRAIEAKLKEKNT